MFTLIQGAELYTPDKLGKRDVLVAGDRIARIAEAIDIPASFDADLVDAGGKLLTPGLIDLHVHILGGGGEGGFWSRTPEIKLSSIVRAGVTTVAGCIGTDDVTRTPEALLAKAMQLEEEGISTVIYTGSYQFPPATITGRVRKDIALIPKVIGVGELAISDHRSSQPTFEEFCRIAAEARVGGMIGGKPGLVHLHVGSGSRRLDYVLRAIEETEIPIGQFLPTHLTRTEELFEHALEFARLGGNLDLTVAPENLGFNHDVKRAIALALEHNISVDQITLSSDSNGSMPIFDAHGNLKRLAVGDIQSLFLEFKHLIGCGYSLSDVLRWTSANPAKRLGLFNRKGSIEEGKDADLLLLTPDFEIDSVFARGRCMVRNGEVLVKGAFED
jgi:beta-aspartyl-dipeptidase (metallo-type)